MSRVSERVTEERLTAYRTKSHLKIYGDKRGTRRFETDHEGLYFNASFWKNTFLDAVSIL